MALQAERGKMPRSTSPVVLLQARDPIEAIRLRAHRLKVYKRGLLMAHSEPVQTTLNLPGRSASTRFFWPDTPAS